MRMAKDLVCFAAAALGLFSLTATALAENPWVFLPTRVLEIEGGAVSFQSAVIVDTRQQLSNPLFQDYPTKYILATTNESNSAIWVETAWRVPGEKPFVSFGQLSPNEYGLFFVKIKEVVWDTPVPVGVTIYANKKKKRNLGGRDVVLLFQDVPGEKMAFLESARQVNSTTGKSAIAHGKKIGMPLLPGFQEMIDMLEPVPGTAADEKLAEDIRLLLWKNQSRNYWDCDHEVLDARSIDATESENFNNLTDENKLLIEEGQALGNFSFEEWRIKSCDSIASYLVTMGKSPNGGTDVAAVMISESVSPEQP